MQINLRDATNTPQMVMSEMHGFEPHCDSLCPKLPQLGGSGVAHFQTHQMSGIEFLLEGMIILTSFYALIHDDQRLPSGYLT